ncbi:MAG: hypothetical protein CVT92_03740 [Bacteroidetes bacterium HGW-Bacteroidetes-1]|jgi:hypothetical protein|nr:MAG: hypothetical protein CVT92_03740 [Bacteroidetes bacterium HGW-Bacteroidetes-1]
MSKTTHRIYLAVMVVIVFFSLVYLTNEGYGYYKTGIEDRYFHEDHLNLKPSGLIGHGLGIIGTLIIVIGVFGYMARKRYRSLRKIGLLKHWLEFHIFLCTLGPIMVLFHTSFKFGGVVAISFWSMVAVFLSGIIGRFIYIQIPRTIEGRELSLNEVREMKAVVGDSLPETLTLDTESYNRIVELTRLNTDSGKKSGFFISYFEDQKALRKVHEILKQHHLPKPQRRTIVRLVKGELALNHRIERLQTMQNLFKYWHVAHLPFALVMLVIMVIHVGVTVIFGFKWIF